MLTKVSFGLKPPVPLVVQIPVEAPPVTVPERAMDGLLVQINEGADPLTVGGFVKVTLTVSFLPGHALPVGVNIIVMVPVAISPGDGR